MDTAKLRESITTHRTALLSIVSILIGLFLLYAANAFSVISDRPAIQQVVSQTGSLAIATVAISLVWHLFLRRSFLAEVMQHAQLAEEVRGAGLTGITNNFTHGLDWESLIDGASRVDILVGYAQSWRNHHRTRLESIGHTNGAKVRIVLPDPENEQIISELSRKWGGMDDEIVRNRIQEAAEDFSGIFDSQANDFELWYCSMAWNAPKKLIQVVC